MKEGVQRECVERVRNYLFRVASESVERGLGITNFYNGMILSTLSISFHGFAFSFSKRPHTNGDSVSYL